MKNKPLQFLIISALLALSIIFFTLWRRASLRVGVLDSKVQELTSLNQKLEADKSMPASLSPDATMAAEAIKAASLRANADRRKTPTPTSYFSDAQPKSIIRYLELCYRDILLTLNLPKDKLAKLRSLLLERTLAEKDAREVASTLGPSYRNSALTAAQSEIDNEIKNLVGSDAYNTVSRMLAASAYIQEVRNSYAVDFSLADRPLSPQELLDLSYAFYEVRSPIADPGAMFRPNPIDPAIGLSESDKKILSKAAAFLGPEQLEILRVNLVAERRIRGEGPSIQMVP